MKFSLLQRVICGLHAATLTTLEANKQRSILHFPLPDFSKWHFLDDESASDDKRTVDDGPAGDDWPTTKCLNLDRELSAFLRNLFAEFHKAVQPASQRHKGPATTPSLIVACIKLLDKHPQGGFPLRFHSALYFFVTTTWRNDPGMFDRDPSVAQALVASAEDLNSTPNTPNRSKEIAIRLRAIANGPKYVTSWQYAPSETIASLCGDPVKDDPECLSEFIHATAAVLEAVLARESRPGVPDWRYYIDRKVVRPTVAPSCSPTALPSTFPTIIQTTGCRTSTRSPSHSHAE